MRKTMMLLSSVVVLLLIACGGEKQEQATVKSDKLQVAVFQGHGGSETCVWEAMAAVEMDAALEARLLTTKDIADGKLSEIDVLIVPGGGGSRQYLNMGSAGREAVQQFVRDGGGYVGICAGAYLITDTPEYASLAMSGAEAHDIEHDNRGRGIAKVTLTEDGRGLFPEVADQDTLYIMYYEGPVVLPNPDSNTKYTSFATMESDVHVEGNAPADMTNGKSFLYIAEYGKGKTASVVGHPEATPGMQWMISKMVHKVSPRAVEPRLNRKFIDPSKFGQEILMTAERRQKESESFQTFLYGSDEAQLLALDWLMQNNSWDAKRWIQGLLFDKRPEMRRSVAHWLGWSLYRMYLPDLQIAHDKENDPEVKAEMARAIEQLK